MRSKKSKIICMRILGGIFTFLMLGALLSIKLPHVFQKVQFIELQKPMYFATTVAVDGSGQLYYYSLESGYIQVYDNDGEFMFSIVAPGPYEWMIDTEDHLHLYVNNRAWDLRHVVIDQRMVIADEVMEAEAFYEAHNIARDRDKSHYEDDEGYQYKVNGRKVTQMDTEGNVLKVIKPPIGPLWPPPTLVFFILITLGACYSIGIIDLAFNKNKNNEIIGLPWGVKK